MNHKKDVFDMVLRLLEREDHLINSRMTWYLTIQGLIVASVTLAFTGDFKSFPHLQIPSIYILSLLGIAISIVVFVAVRRAREVKRKLHEQWEHWEKAESIDADWIPDPRGDTSRWSMFTPGQAVPCIIIAFWIAVIVSAYIG